MGIDRNCVDLYVCDAGLRREKETDMELTKLNPTYQGREYRLENRVTSHDPGNSTADPQQPAGYITNPPVSLPFTPIRQRNNI